MKITRHISLRIALLISVATILVVESTRLAADTAICGGASVTLPFTDVPSGNIFFCSIAEAFFSSLSNGTSPTTYNPSGNVPREQMAAFVSRTLDQSLRRGNRRAALNQWYTPPTVLDSMRTPVGSTAQLIQSDGSDLWAAVSSGSVTRVRASDGRIVETWTGAVNAFGVLVAFGRVWVTGTNTPGTLYVINPTLTAGAVTPFATTGAGARGIATDGVSLWVANTSGSVSIVNPSTAAVTNITTGFTNPNGILFDGANIWVTDFGDSTIKKLDAGGAVLASVPTGSNPTQPAFDGTNIWVPNVLSVTVVRAKDAAGNPLAVPFVLTTLTGNGLDLGFSAAFDGQRVLVTSRLSQPATGRVSLWKAADLSPLGTVMLSGVEDSLGACSDGVNFWVTTPTHLLRL